MEKLVQYEIEPITKRTWLDRLLARGKAPTIIICYPSYLDKCLLLLRCRLKNEA